MAPQICEINLGSSVKPQTQIYLHENCALYSLSSSPPHTLFTILLFLFCIRGRGQLKCDGTSADTRFRLSTKRTSPFKPAGASVQSPTGSRGVRISGNNAGYTMLRRSVKSTGYPLHSPVSPSLRLQCVIVCHHIST